MLRDERGVAYVETLIAFPVMFALFNAMMLFGYVSTASLIVQRAASAAARAAVVFLPDDPEYYDRTDGPGGKPLTLIQSWAILYYLAEKTGKLMPSDLLARARTYQWIGEAASDMAPTAQNIFFLGNRMPEKVPDSAIKFYEDRLVTQFRAADEQLARAPYLTGNEITVADLGLYPIYAGRKALIDGAGLKNVTAWGERVGARPGVQKGMRLES